MELRGPQNNPRVAPRLQPREPLGKHSTEQSMGSKPLSVMDMDDPTSYRAILEELRSLNATVADLAAGQNEVRSSLGRLEYVNFAQQRRSDSVPVGRGDDSFVKHGHVGHVGNVSGLAAGGHASRPTGTKEALNVCTADVSSLVAPGRAANADLMSNADQVTDAHKLVQVDLQHLQITVDIEEDSKQTDNHDVTHNSTLPKSRSSFNLLQTKDEDISELRGLLLRAEEIGQATEQQKQPFLQRLSSLSRKEQELALDSCIGYIIALNAAFLGYSSDAPISQEDVIFSIDIAFSVVFILELVLKLRLNGLRGQFCGEAAKLNIFDASIILVDTLQLMLAVLLTGEEGGGFLNMPYISMLRMLRLVRLARMLRLLRLQMFDELITMVSGMAGGLSTLCWAMVLYFFVVYVASLIFREALGHKKFDNVFEYFQDVPRSMFTVFRCSFGDCSSAGGMPIFEYVDMHYGAAYSLFYCVFMFGMTIGLFNVISAIFVDATLAATASMRLKAKKERLQDGDLWATRIGTLVRKLAAHENMQIKVGGSLVDILDNIYEMDVTLDTMAAIARDDEVKEALDDLDIDPEDHEQLAVILDPDQGGTIAVIELIEGIKRLRGDPKRSDIVQIDLMLRSIMKVVQEIRTSAEAACAAASVANFVPPLGEPPRLASASWSSG
eukprot:TRINITY_DN24324_c0_g3_i1.p1 TRINITY_DN24324_c0_g3~~TRINITY_DN24324_c0_g3_i1.p1  ORF type:complete len:668 (+),score=148.92 TRINITY_DN24324_c0_g3_i1:136-2139(+)